MDEELDGIRGMLSGLMFAVGVAIALHPERRAVVETLKADDALNMFAMAHAGHVVQDESFRATLQHLAKAIEKVEKGMLPASTKVERLSTNLDTLAGSDAVHDLLLQALIAFRYRDNLPLFDGEMGALRAVAEMNPSNETNASKERVQDFQVNMLAQMDMFMRSARSHLVATATRPGANGFPSFGTGRR
jgi:hypothetical protein